MFKHRHIPPEQVIAAEPYTALAQIYDQVMNHVDYDHWARHLIRLARLHGVEPRTVLDVSCGTGTLCREFQSRGFRVLGCDASLPMVKIAAAFRSSRAAIPYWCTAMDRVAIRTPVELVLSSYDSMNYLLEPQQWQSAFQRLHELLVPGGLFIFDISTLRNSTETFADYVHQEEFAEGSYRRTSLFDAERNIQYNYFEIELSSAPGCLYKEVHSQSIRALAQVEDFIALSPFTLLGQYANFTLRPGSERAERVHFVLKKGRETCM
ncbi:MAG: bifunctional 3-demethylubiquinone-9 3-methyltransferase/ 2-octaprenyl-6-hydroxy phenol methylase [bacterium ADurb.Bin431]|nr:MAG: bifunctional 3-demethylubiquinone-9 3-methyltransferase/ 2-octaprenyl-6-hydroxy phenol methylase [bacterium ADurb.Bin431]HNY90583.1 class I SAM-dependent methyltransferase [bacterium]HOC24077.1 class I SAM-dependent methyltransferase [bacterium]HOH06028.1 class I SAM-dependent methyltransferase [bacterium]HOY44699.1 class I SAM-dependent methyltransferase [bacterium]